MAAENSQLSEVAFCSELWPLASEILRLSTDSSCVWFEQCLLQARILSHTRFQIRQKEDNMRGDLPFTVSFDIHDSVNCTS